MAAAGPVIAGHDLLDGRHRGGDGDGVGRRTGRPRLTGARNHEADAGDEQQDAHHEQPLNGPHAIVFWHIASQPPTASDEDFRNASDFFGATMSGCFAPSWRSRRSWPCSWRRSVRRCCTRISDDDHDGHHGAARVHAHLGGHATPITPRTAIRRHSTRTRVPSAPPGCSSLSLSSRTLLIPALPQSRYALPAPLESMMRRPPAVAHSHDPPAFARPPPALRPPSRPDFDGRPSSVFFHI